MNPNSSALGLQDQSINMTVALAHMRGDKRTEQQIASDGARITISLIDKLRRQLDQAERAAQRVQAGKPPLKDDDAIWRRVARAADKLLDGLV